MQYCYFYASKEYQASVVGSEGRGYIWPIEEDEEFLPILRGMLKKWIQCGQTTFEHIQSIRHSDNEMLCDLSCLETRFRLLCR